MNRAFRMTCLVVIVLGAMLRHSVAQVPSPSNRFLTAENLAAVVGTEGAASIVREALAHRLRMSSTRNTTTVMASQIPEEWLPTIPNVRFERLSDDVTRAHFQQCGWVLYVHLFRLVNPDTAEIAVAERNDCRSSGTVLQFKRSADMWQIYESGMQGGFGGGVSRCRCR